MKKFFKVLVCIIAIEIIAACCILMGQDIPIEVNLGGSQNATPATVQTESSIEFGTGYESLPHTNNQEEPKNAEQVADVESVLNITLSGTYLETYQKATKGLSNSTVDRNRKMIAKIGLQILQSKVIKYENALHFYSLTYSASGGTAKAKTYNLKNCIDRINKGQTIYTDCFGFVRLTHSIACYTLNPSNPESVQGMSGLYGYKGSYTGAGITSLDKLACGTVIYDRLTGTGSTTNRHVAMYLYTENGKVVYIDQSRIFSGEHKESSYIYSKPGSRAYKFNTYKNYCA